MGRFYQTAKPEFVDDFIYQPPWELMQQRLQKEQNDYDVSLGTTDLLGSPDIQYIEDEVEKQKVKEIQDEYNNKATQLTEKMKQAGNDWRKYLPEMNKLKRDLESDYKTGRIHNIQTSAANYAEMEKQLAGIKDPAIKQKARESFLNKWRENPNRSLDGIFQSNEIYDKKDLTGEFLTEWSKNKEPDIISKAFAYADGKGYLHNGTEEVKIRQDAAKAYEDFIKAKNYQPYLQQQEGFGFGKYFEEDGQTLIPFSDPRSTGYNEAKYSGLLGNYKQEKKTKDIGADSTYNHKQDLAFEKYKFAMSNKPESEVIAAPTKEANFKTIEQLDMLNKVFSDKMNSFANSIGGVKTKRTDGRITPNDVRNRLKQLESNANNPKAKQNVANLKKQFGEVLKTYDSGYRDASYTSFAEHYGIKETKNAQTQISGYEKDPRKFYSVPGHIEIKGKTYKGTFYDVLENPQKFGLKESDVYEIETDSKTGKKTRLGKLNEDINDYYVQGSTLPLVMPGEGNWEYNDLVQEFEINGIPIKSQYSFRDLGILPIRN